MKLTKTQFLQFLQCKKALWLSNNKSLPQSLPDIATKYRIKEGAEVEEYAYQLFPDGVPAETANFLASETTRELITIKAPAIFQAVIENEYTQCRSDIIAHNKNSKKWDIYEVKSSTEVKEEHLFDIAFQAYCYAQANIPIGNLSVIHINNEYNLDETGINPEQLLTITDVTTEVLQIYSEIPALVNEAISTQTSSNEPSVLILKQCNNPYPCPYIDYCWKDIPDESIYELAGKLKDEHLQELVEKNKLLIKDIPPEYLTRKDGLRHWKTITEQSSNINSEVIKKELSQLDFPLYFLDYETFAPAIPVFAGYTPYQLVIFQYSLHVLYEDGKLEHKEFLLQKKESPVISLVKSLREHIGGKGSVISWNQSFEQRCNKNMAEMFPEQASFLLNINERMYDIRKPFQEGYYTHRGFKGSSSIKKVLPVIVPELSYKALNIQEGGTASYSWWEMIQGDLPVQMKKQREEDLLRYCELDTLAMVRIYEHLAAL